MIPAEHDKDETIRLLKLLGKLASELPPLNTYEWDNIFRFIDYYMIVKEERPPQFLDFDWNKVKEILTLLGKVD